MSSSSLPIVVVGSGVIGLSAALHLRAATDRHVVVLEAGLVGQGTTPAGAGFVAPWATVLPYLGAPGLALVEYSLDYYNAIAASGADIKHRDNGNIVFFNESQSFTATTTAILQNPQASKDTKVITSAEVADLTSGAVDASQIAGGILMPRGIQLETNLLVDHLAELARAAGVEIRTHTTVESISTDGRRLRGLRLRNSYDASDLGDLETDCAVLAVGAWLNDLLETVGWKLPLLPFVATRFVTEDVGLSPTMPTLQGKDFPLWIRESDGGFTWGTTPGTAPAHRLGTGWTSHVAPERTYSHLVEAMAADTGRVAKVFPALEGARVVHTIQGMPVYTVDRQFFVGDVPSCAGLWAVGGDNESGVSHAPGLGRLIADLVTDSHTPICDAALYRLDRFAPTDYPDAEAVGQKFVDADDGFIAEAMTAPAATG